MPYGAKGANLRQPRGNAPGDLTNQTSAEGATHASLNRAFSASLLFKIRIPGALPQATFDRARWRKNTALPPLLFLFVELDLLAEELRITEVLCQQRSDCRGIFRFLRDHLVTDGT